MCGITVNTYHSTSWSCRHYPVNVEYCEDCPFISKRPSQSGFKIESQVYSSGKYKAKISAADELAECPNWNDVQKVFVQEKCLCKRWETFETWDRVRRHRYDYGIHVGTFGDDMLDDLSNLAKQYKSVEAKKLKEWFLEEQAKIKEINADGEAIEKTFTNITEELERLARRSRERGDRTKSWWFGGATGEEAMSSSEDLIEDRA